MDSLERIMIDYRKSGKDKEISLDEIKEELDVYKGRIVLYGAGSAGIAFFHYLKDVGIEIAYFSDGDVEKQGKECEGYKIISPKSIVSMLGEDALVIVTINTDGHSYCKDFKEALLKNGHEGVHKTLQECGCKNVIDYTYFRRCYELFRGEQYNLPACNDVYLMEENWQKIQQVYNWLCDDISRETFIKILEFRMLDDSADIPTFPERDMYFEYSLFNRRSDEVFVDCGACSGSSLKDFFRVNGKEFEKCISIEPDCKNYEGLAEYVNSLEEEIRNKIEIIHAGAYSSDGVTQFYELSGPGTFAAESGPNQIRTVTIDKILDRKKATYVKMNIEGSEVPALKGACYTLQKYKPRLAIMGYHKTSDLWEVPYTIKEANPEYKLYLKSYMHNIAFAYYAC
ncbi:FkbM family methyltransferase [bacterium D16-51]|nr:FkbM family methyltransferase [bacterium D16-59]RKI62808.1 FkbM family methyltransferase [bacterium D16-51]